MRIGVTGHQDREGADWACVERALRKELAHLTDAREAFSSLAAGTDQLFTETALGLGIPVTAVIPLTGYERFFESQALARYRQLLGQCRRLDLDWKGDEERAFFEAGKYIVQHVDTIFAVWDGKEAEGLGGTADVVNFARKSGKRIIHLNPLTQSVSRM